MTWRDDLPEDLKDDPAIADIPDITTLAKSYRDGQKQIGRLSQDAIRRPSDNASADDMAAAIAKVQQRWPELMLKPDESNPDQWTSVLKSMGFPDEPDGYELPELDEDNRDRFSDYLSNLKHVGHKAGLTKRQLKSLAEALVQQQIEAVDNATKSHKQQQEQLSEEWGAAFDRNMRIVKALAEKTEAPAALVEQLSNGGASPETVRWLHKLATNLGDEVSEIHSQQNNPLEVSPMEAQAQIDEIMRNKDHDIFHPERGGAHQRARENLQKLYKIKQGKQYKDKAVNYVGGITA